MQAQHGNELTTQDDKNQQVKKHHDHLKGRTKERIIQLKNCVFPIQEIDSQAKSQSFQRQIFSSGDSWSDEEDDTVSALMAATSNYWGRPDELVSSFGTCHSIPGPYGPTLPASGDYSAYGMWTERNQGRVTSGGSSGRDPSHCIAAALTYTTQFVNLVAYYLDLRLPHRLSYTEFANGDLATKFNRKVAKLNANIVHLCASQGIAPTFLHPRQTISNLLLLFDPEHADLGRRGPFEVSIQLAKSMEDSIEKDLVIFEEDRSESDSDWNDSFPSDWENVQRGAIEEFSLQEMTNQSYCQSVSTYQTDSFARSRNATTASMMTGGLVSSVTSFFRGWRK
ncbi:unnamed protein product [Orchesella dallaii]|uniref:Beclin 1-associated autophagy-related key regulator n=1 Tax=Orchesella dallaii TaxID=48710 RepID=A0ABP1PYJ2_9HEXA